MAESKLKPDDSEIDSSAEPGYCNTKIPDEKTLAEFDNWIKSNAGSRVVLAIAGKSGAGKSTFVNNFLGINEAESYLSPKAVTAEVGEYEHSVNGVPVRIIDAPGLHARRQKEEDRQRIVAKLSLLNEKEAVSIMLYCISLAQRIDQTDDKIIESLNTAFGKEIWNHTIFVLTWADCVEKNKITSLVAEFKTEIEDMLTSSGVVLSQQGDSKPRRVITVITSKDPMVPPEWRIKLLTQIITQCKQQENIVASFLQLQGISGDYIKSRLVAAGVVVLGGTLTGAATGAKIGAFAGPHGAVIGALVGGVVGVSLGSPAAYISAELFRVCISQYELYKIKDDIRKEDKAKKKNN